MKRISLSNTEFEGNNNAYLFVGDRTVLVDTGIAVPPVADQLESGLADHDVTPSDLDAILLTHWHADHSGLAGGYQSASNAVVRAGARDAGLAANDERALANLATARNRQLDDWGLPSKPRRELIAFMEDNQSHLGDPATVHSVEDGELIQAGDETLTAVYTPGHTAGHVSFVRENGTVLTGDALLPYYTPNVGGADPRVEDPLGTYLATLEKLYAGNYDRAYPGHRDPIDDPGRRAAEILAHHRRRAQLVLDILESIGPADPWTVSGELFGPLEGIHIIHGPGEAYAHLEHLTRAGLVARTTGGYLPVEDPPMTLPEVFPEFDA